MKRWAELLIIKVKKDEKDRITHVKVKIDAITHVLGEVELTKEEIILLLKDNSQIKTAYQNTSLNLAQIDLTINSRISPEYLATTPITKGKSNYLEGSTVTYYKETNGIEYLKTYSNEKSKDNLDNLPTY